MRFLLPVLFLASAALALRPQHFQQGAAPEPIQGLVGTEIGDIVWSGRYVWVATESGLARLDPERASGLDEGDWITFTEAHGLGRGAVSALAASGDTVWAATLIDTLVPGQGAFQAGTGLSFSADAGATWRHFANAAIFDTTRAGFRRGPTTPIFNACFALAIDRGTLWAGFMAGSLVRSADGGRSWQRVLPDGAGEIVYFAGDTAADSLAILADSLARQGADQQTLRDLRARADSLSSQALLHRTFSLLAYEDTLWVGTASGIARSFDGGSTWSNHKVRLDEAGEVLPGHPAANWVVALGRQRLQGGGTALWAGTRATDLPGERTALSVSRDLGRTWEHTGPTFAWNFAFTPSLVWAATDQGLLASPEPAPLGERSWVEVSVVDGEALRGPFVGLETVGQVLWAGAENGLGRSEDEGRTWRIIKTPFKTRSLDRGAFVGEGGLADSAAVTYAAPNPFSPARQEQAAIVFSLSSQARVSIDIFDFASRRVRRLLRDEPFAGAQNHRVNWDGRDEDDRAVANGVYFYRIELDSGRQAFGKVVVLD